VRILARPFRIATAVVAVLLSAFGPVSRAHPSTSSGTSSAAALSSRSTLSSTLVPAGAPAAGTPTAPPPAPLSASHGSAGRPAGHWTPVPLPANAARPSARFGAADVERSGIDCGAGPPGRSGGSAVGAVLFGGMTASGQVLGDTWVFHNGTSRNLTTPNGPPPRYDASAAVLMARSVQGAVALFGGLGANHRPLGNTWELDCSGKWTDVGVGRRTAPSPRSLASMAQVLTSPSGVLLFGGRDAQNRSLGDTRMFDGQTRSEVATSGSPGVPPPRDGRCSWRCLSGRRPRRSGSYLSCAGAAVREPSSRFGRSPPRPIPRWTRPRDAGCTPAERAR
jgi:hypothetical protein